MAMLYRSGTRRFHWRRFPNRCLKEPETENPIELQQAGWKMILDNFIKHVEAC